LGAFVGVWRTAYGARWQHGTFSQAMDMGAAYGGAARALAKKYSSQVREL